MPASSKALYASSSHLRHLSLGPDAIGATTSIVHPIWTPHARCRAACRGLLDADQLDALGTLRRTDSAPNLGEQERLPFRQRRAVKKAAKAGRKQEKADRKAERKAHKVRVHRQAELDTQRS